MAGRPRPQFLSGPRRQWRDRAKTAALAGGDAEGALQRRRDLL
jgi:hypothetical protein